MTKEKRFEKVYSQGMSTNEIWVDTQTGVQYFYDSGGMAVLVDAEGKPLLYRRTPNAPEY